MSVSRSGGTFSCMTGPFPQLVHGRCVGRVHALPVVAASMRRPVLSTYFSRPVLKISLPTSGRRHALRCFLLRRKVFVFPSPDTPCFHSHSSWSSTLRCKLVSSFLKRVLPSQCRTDALRCGSARSAATSQSPELGRWSIQTLRDERLAAQRAIHFRRHPQAVQQDRQFARHRHHRSLFLIL